MVTPFAGVWIEIIKLSRNSLQIYVTPFAGVWIEIPLSDVNWSRIAVTPFAGVWIEIEFVKEHEVIGNSHSLRGSVD